MFRSAGIVLFIGASIWALVAGLNFPLNKILESAESLKMSPYKIPIFIAFCILICFVNVPLGVVTKVLSGWLFGFYYGAILAHLSIFLGSYLAFRWSRFLGQKIVAQKYSNYLEKINQQISKNEFMTLFQIRIFPFIPLPVANFCLGVTSVSDWKFILAGALGMFPAALFYAYIGSQIDTLSKESLNFSNFIPYYIYIISALLLSTLAPFLFKKHKGKVKI